MMPAKLIQELLKLVDMLYAHLYSYITLHYTFQQMVCLVLIAVFKFLSKTGVTRTQDRDPITPYRTK